MGTDIFVFTLFLNFCTLFNKYASCAIAEFINFLQDILYFLIAGNLEPVSLVFYL